MYTVLCNWNSRFFVLTAEKHVRFQKILAFDQQIPSMRTVILCNSCSGVFGQWLSDLFHQIFYQIVLGIFMQEFSLFILCLVLLIFVCWFVVGVRNVKWSHLSQANFQFSKLSNNCCFELFLSGFNLKVYSQQRAREERVENMNEVMSKPLFQKSYLSSFLI